MVLRIFGWASTSSASAVPQTKFGCLKYWLIIEQTKDFQVSMFSGWLLALPAHLCSAASLASIQSRDSMLKVLSAGTVFNLLGKVPGSCLGYLFLLTFTYHPCTLRVLPVLIFQTAGALPWAVKISPCNKWWGSILSLTLSTYKFTVERQTGRYQLLCWFEV